MSILRVNEFKALPGRFEDLVKAFEAVVRQIRTVDGCERCELLLKIADGLDADDTLIVLEVWTSISAHKQAASAVDPNDFNRIMALLSTRPVGQYYEAVAE
ncbi:hypothetical protein AEAC466_20710 [Asticcacaulis sp. AC466]|uniref:antibiotic biosynthesis monooxygenase family protein n=1 Tax=Asticcacaulis sp. AC466 TaxID=1282362 RepID=UPI0003C3AD62|nr:antibiotic biosynthesis monooxygenase family protein [Asticcacaulis sp. AC466]ESQ81719.1 hypothetical protein AEAC466_20710 [Asticcacaulis sp. AC466]